eukprot:820427_1
MQHFIPNQIYTIPQHQQIPQQIQQAIPSGAYQVNPNQYPSFPPTPQYRPQPSYAYAPQHQRPNYHHAPQQSIGGIPYGYTATSPVDNYSVYNGSVYGGHPGVATPGAPPPSVITNPQHQQQPTLTHYQQLMAMQNQQAQAFKQQYQQYESHAQRQQPNQWAPPNGYIPTPQMQPQKPMPTQPKKKLHAAQESQRTTIVYNDEEQEVEDQDAADNADDMDDTKRNEDQEDNEEDYTSNDDGNNINDLLEGDAILAGEYVGIIRYLGPL